MKKRIVSTLLALLMIVTLLPLGLVEPAEAAETLDCTVGVAAGKINPAYTDYVNRAMRYYIRNVSALSNVPDGQSILFFFEGVSAVASPNYKAEDYTKSAVRNAAVCLAVKFVNGTPEIYYCEDQCSTFPDMPLEFSYKANGYSPSTIYDGIYKVRLDNHLSGSKEDYAALTLDMSNNYLTGAKTNAFYLCDNDKRGTGKPFTNSQITSGNRSYQIHGHAGETTTQANSFRWSVGCILAGATYGEFSALMAGITGDSSLSSTGKPPLLSEGQKRNFGYVVIDRSQYTAQLEKVYTGSGSYTKNGTTAYYNITSADARDAIHELCKGSLGTDSGGGTTEDVIGSGNCGANGSNVTWKLTSDGTLTISGTGKMADYEWNGAPWARACSEITSIVIEDGVTSIGDYAFPFCTSLTSVTIPDTVTVIGHGAFRDCTSLTSVTIPGGVTDFGTRVFSSCSALKSVTFSDGVTSIGDWAFEGCTSLTGVIIPDSVTSIGSSAFEGCTSLTSLNIPDSVTFIGVDTFKDCTALTEIKLPSALGIIQSKTFSNCVNLTSITIPKSVTYISEKAFYCCDSLTDVYYTGTEADWAKIVIVEGNEDLTNAKLHAATIFTPANVELVGATPAANSITVTWQAAEGASTYVIYRKPAGTNSWAIIARNVSGTSYTDTGVTAGESYTYTVRGVAADGRTMSKGYDTKGVTAKVPAAVTVPANVTMKNAAVSGSSIVVTWDAAEGASTYVIYRKPAGTNSWAIIARNVSGTSYTDTGVTAGESYTYTVRGVAADGRTMSKGYDTKGVTAKVPAAVTVPANVTMKNAAVSGSSIVVTWDAAEGASTYVIYRKPAGTNSWAVIARNVSGTSYTDKSVTAGESYTYTVRGVAADGRTMSKGYDTKGVTAKAPAASGVPANVTLTAAKADSAGILVTWEAAANAQTYTVYRKLTGTNSWAIVARSVAGTAWKDIHADKEISYTYTVRGVAADGRTMSKSYDAKGVTDQVTKAITTPANVTMTAASSSGTGIAVTWEYALDAKTYVIYRKPTGTNNWAIIARNVSGTSYTDKSVTAGESYTYTVRGVAADGRTMSKGYDAKGVTAKAFAVAASSVTG